MAFSFIGGGNSTIKTQQRRREREHTLNIVR
jgi:hypothetical protein